MAGEPAETQTPATDTGANDIKDIMNGMQNQKPGAKPGENTGDNDTGSNGGADGKNGSDIQHPAWMEQLNGDITQDKGAAEKLSKFEKVSDLGKAYLELEGKLGNSIVKPGENASAEEIETFYKNLGKPESADKYSIEGDEAKAFRELAFKNNLTDAQAKALFQSLKEVSQNALEQQKVAFETQAQETQTALRKEYGNDYDTKIVMLKRGVATYGGPKMAAKLQASGLLADYEIVKMFINLGEMSAEAGSPGNTNGKTDDYKSIGEGGTFSFFKK